jgi:hypothetical protein
MFDQFRVHHLVQAALFHVRFFYQFQHAPVLVTHAWTPS